MPRRAGLIWVKFRTELNASQMPGDCPPPPPGVHNSVQLLIVKLLQALPYLIQNQSMWLENTPLFKVMS